VGVANFVMQMTCAGNAKFTQLTPWQRDFWPGRRWSKAEPPLPSAPYSCTRFHFNPPQVPSFYYSPAAPVSNLQLSSHDRRGVNIINVILKPARKSARTTAMNSRLRSVWSVGNLLLILQQQKQ